MAYSVNYPITHIFPNDIRLDYDILLNDTVIYSGIIMPYDTAAPTLSIDISGICRSYLDTFYESVIYNTGVSPVPETGSGGTIWTFVVKDTANNLETPYRVIYDYNTDYISHLPDARHLNDPLDTRVDPRQRLFVCGYNLAGPQHYSATLNGSVVSDGSLDTEQFQMLPLNLKDTTAAAGDTIVMSGVGSDTYKVVPACPHRFALYYVNKYGGLDALLCTGRWKQSWNPTRTDIRLYNDRSNRLGWEQKRIGSEQDHSYQLNTGLIHTGRAEKIDHLIYSPKVWLHDLEKDTVTACLVTDTSYTVKTRRNDRQVFYTVNVKLSQKEVRR